MALSAEVARELKRLTLDMQNISNTEKEFKSFVAYCYKQLGMKPDHELITLLNELKK